MANSTARDVSTVSVTRTVAVYPKTMLHEKKIITLSNLDRQCPLLMYLVFFYNPCSLFKNLSTASVFEDLKSGLEETLSVWYPAAGRLILNPNNGGKLDLYCNNNGAVMIEASTQVKISELGDLSQYDEFYENLVFKPVFNGVFSDMPLIVAQVTKFGCGGYSIGIGTSHSLFDGPAAYIFLRAWASNSAIFKEKGDIVPQKPVHERALTLHANSGTSNVSSQQSIPVIRAAAIDHLYQLIKQALTNPEHDTNKTIVGCNVSGMSSSSTHVLKTFHLTNEMIESLKKSIYSGERRSGFTCSSFEAVVAYLWKARMKALGIKSERTVCLQFAVEARNRMVPQIPKEYSGNAFVLASVVLTAGQLEQHSYQSIIEMIKEAKSSVNNDYVHAYLQALDGPQRNLPPLKELTLVSDWTRMPFHKVKFFGEAAYASPLMSPVPQVAYLMQNPEDDRAIDARIGLHPQHIEAFSCYFLKNMK